jgi:7-cyano-7-deazaguanine synthase
MSKNAIVLLSGGMDSLVSLAIAQKEYTQTFILFADYGQKTLSKEKECFHKIADFYQIPQENRKVFSFDFLKSLGKSSLTDSDIPVSHFNENSPNMPSSYVPFRNTMMIAAAVAWAEVSETESIFIGANELDATGYPDCRSDYFSAYQKLISIGANNKKITLQTPIIKMTKAQIIQLGMSYNAPFELSWSCYKNLDVPCGECDSCHLRLDGFKELGLIDPLMM